jgi:uncharacterized protein with HEPN domain
MNERDEVRLRDMLDAASKAEKFIVGKSRESLDIDDLLAFGLVRAIEIIGEAASRVTPETRQTSPQIPWKDIVGMRNKVIHNYNDVDYNLVWDTVTLDLPPLIVELEKILSSKKASNQ